LSREVGLDTHIADVTNLMVWKDLSDIVRVGHSYGGFVVRHFADRLLACDYVPDKGKKFRELAATTSDGWKLPPRRASSLAVNAADADWVDRRCTMQPLSTFEAPAQISGACDAIPNIGYVRARSYNSLYFDVFYALAGERRWWREQFACGHDVMLDMPNELTTLLLQRV
jgi:hypothetical protein